MAYFIHKKTGKRYEYIGHAENKSCDGQMMVVYSPSEADENTIYVRDAAEFEEKFEREDSWITK